MLCRIITENKNRDEIVSIVKYHFDGFTIIPTIGYWQGIAEKSLVVEISGYFDDTMIDGVEKIAERIKVLNNQDAVLVQWLECKSELK